MGTGIRAVLCLVLWIAGAAPAVASLYQVEIIVFAHTPPDADGEQWVSGAGMPAREGMAVLAGAGEGTGNVAPLPPSSYRLNGVMGALRRVGRYQPVLHTSWLQADRGGVRGVFFSQTPASSTELSLTPDPTRLQGNVRLRVTRFLHVDMDIAYLPEPDVAAGTAAPDGAPVSEPVRLQESRKIKLNEVHYFDHPLFGVLLQVSRAGGEDASTTDE
ncbi:MAG: hypothetical protein HYR49_06900 [Gammaproteobacteria bacterium]|nr:hypothetical protein [Gammaproteobacteria bacterium]